METTQQQVSEEKDVEYGFLSALTHDENGVLSIWSDKFCVITSSASSSTATGTTTIQDGQESKSGDVLMIYTLPSDESPEIEIPLLGADVSVVVGDSEQEDIRNSFALTTGSGDRVYLRAKSEEEMFAWVKSIRKKAEIKNPSLPPPSQDFNEEIMHNIPHPSAGYIYAFDNLEGWREVFAVVLPGRLLLYRHASDKDPLAGVFSLVHAIFRLVPNPPREQIQVIFANTDPGEIQHQPLYLMGNDSIDTHQWLTTLTRRSLEETNDNIPITLASSAYDAYMYLRRIATSNLDDLDFAAQRQREADALAFIAVGSLKMSTAGSPATFDIRCTALKEQESFEIDGGDFEVYLSRPADFDGSMERCARGIVSAHAAPLVGDIQGSSGGFSAKISHTFAGRYRLHIRLGRSPIFGSPFPFTVLPTSPSPAHSTIMGTGASHAVPDETVSFTVTLRDRYLNLARLENPPAGSNKTGFQVKIHGAAILETIEKNDADETGTSFEVFYRATTSELSVKNISANDPNRIRIEVLLNGIHIAGSPLIPHLEGQVIDNSLFQNDLTSSITHRNIPVFVFPNEEKDASNDIENYIQERKEIEGLKKSAHLANAKKNPNLSPAEKAIDRAVDTAIEARETALDALAAAKAVIKKSEEAAMALTHAYKQELRNSERGNLLDEEKLGMIMGSAGIRTMARSPIVTVFEERNSGTKVMWRKELPPPPWASLSTVEAYIKRIRSRLDEALEPLREAIEDECNQLQVTQPHAQWKQYLLSWPGPNATLSQLEQLKHAIADCPLEHSNVLVEMIDLIIEGEADLASRRKFIPGATEPIYSDIEKQKALEILRSRKQDSNEKNENTPSGWFHHHHNQQVDTLTEEDDNEEDQDNNHASTAIIQATNLSERLPLRLGARVSIDDEIEGVIKFFGPVQFEKGNWVGVELDSADEGRNDGSVQGVRYFECEQNIGAKEIKNFGIFVRPERVTVLEPFPKTISPLKKSQQQQQQRPSKSPQKKVRPQDELEISIGQLDITTLSDLRSERKNLSKNNDGTPKNDNQKPSTPTPIISKPVPNAVKMISTAEKKPSPSPKSATMEKKRTFDSPNSEAKLLKPGTPKSIPVQKQMQETSFQGSSPRKVEERNEAYPNTKEWFEVEDWLDLCGITRSYERKAVLDAFLSANIINLRQVSRLTGDQLNKMPLSFELRMKLLTNVKKLNNS